MNSTSRTVTALNKLGNYTAVCSHLKVFTPNEISRSRLMPVASGGPEIVGDGEGDDLINKSCSRPTARKAEVRGPKGR